jgi:hypothetical protein
MNWISGFVSYRETSESLGAEPGNVHCPPTRSQLVYGYSAEHYFETQPFRITNYTSKIMNFEIP